MLALTAMLSGTDGPKHRAPPATPPATRDMRNCLIDLSDTLNSARVALTRASLEGAVLGGVRPLVLISHPVDE